MLVRPFRHIVAVCVALTLAACGAETPLQPGAGLADVQADGLAEARAGGFPVVILGSGADGKGATASTLQEAVGKVQDGGTIKVLKGTWDADGVVIDKAVRISGQGPASVLRLVTSADPAPHAALSIEGVNVVLEDLTVDVTQATNVVGIRAIGDFETLTVDEVSVVGGGPPITFWAFGSSAPRHIEVKESSFRDCVGYCIVTSGPATEIEISSLEAERCGRFNCISMFGGSSGRVVDSHLSNASATSSPFFHHVIIGFGGGDAEIVGNTIDGCGEGQCVAISGGSTGEVRGNHIAAYADQGTRFGIIVSDGGIGQGAQATVVDNVVVGVGSNPDNDGGYAIGCGGGCGLLQAEGGSSADFSGNDVTNGVMGIVSRTGSQVTGRDNRVTTVRTGMAAWDGSDLAVRFSDVTGYDGAADGFGAGPGSDLTCNWWGDAAGPDPVSAPASLYTPWATAPVAGTGAEGC